jgi:hypothetical protein
MYSDPALFPQGIIATNNVPEFDFLPTMTVGTQYYVSAIAGDKLTNGNVNPTDPCLSLSPPVVVTFSAAPSATITVDTSVCEGQNVIIPIAFTGTGPYTFVYALNGVNQFPIQVPTNTFSVSSTNILSQQIYTLISVANSTCPGTVIGSASIGVIPSPKITLSGDAKICPETPTEITLTMTGGANYDVVLTGNPGGPTTLNGVASGYKEEYSLTQTTTFSVTSFSANGNLCAVKIGNDFTVLVEEVAISANAADLNGFSVSYCGNSSRWHHTLYLSMEQQSNRKHGK